MTVPSISALVELPAELLHHILVLVSPTDLSSLSQTCRALHDHISVSDHLWKQIYHVRWDQPRHLLDPLITQPCPQTSLPLSAKGKGKGKEMSDGSEQQLFLETFSYTHRDTFDHATQIRRRTWAEKSFNARPIDMVSNYNETLRTLLSIARSRATRDVDGGGPSRNCRFLTEKLTSNAGSNTFRRLVYPRADISRLREWQMNTLVEKYGKGTYERIPMKRKVLGDKRGFPMSPSSISREGKRRRGPADSMHRTRRRSTRLLLQAYPPELHHFLLDKDGNNVLDLDNADGTLEELDLLDEQLAAELHVLHGIRPHRGSKAGSSSCHVADDDAQEYGGSVSEATGSSRAEDSEHDVSDREDEDEEDQQQQQHHHHHEHHHGHHHHLPFEQSLGSETGYEGDTYLRGRAKQIVYDTARYGPENSHGPLRAWRARIDWMDGPRLVMPATAAATTGAGEGEESGDGSSSEHDSSGVDEDEDGNSVSSTPTDQSEVPIIDLTNEETSEGAEDHHLFQTLQEIGWNPEEDEEEDDDDDFEIDEDEDDEERFLFEVRETNIALSHGLYPYHESRRLERAQADHAFHTGRKNCIVGPIGSDVFNPRDVWHMEKRIDWVVVEAIMIVMWCNVSHGARHHGWGHAFRLPVVPPSLTARAEARTGSSNRTRGRSGNHVDWTNLTSLPSGWNMSRGEERTWGDEPNDPKNKNEKRLHDWAFVESTWIGTYAFLDWSKWAAYNARDPLSRGIPESSLAMDPTRPVPLGSTNSMPSLKNEREAVGDCLQLRMELLPLESQQGNTMRDRAIEALEGPQSEKYPPLRFRGHTLTHDDEGPPAVRGQLHGLVRPVFAQAHEEYYRDGKTSGKERAIVGLHWDLVHRYDGEDRWSLSGIQPGPPGTRAPILGIWKSAQQDDISPCGPFCYWRVCDTPWKEVDKILASEQHM